MLAIYTLNTNVFLHLLSISAQVIFRGNRSAGYGFVAVSTSEAAYKAVELLDKQELDGRELIVEIAKPADQKDKDKKEKKAKRKPGRRGSKAVPGEVTDAEANGEAKAEGAASATDEGAKPKKKKKNTVCQLSLIYIRIRLFILVQRKARRTTAEGGEEEGGEAGEGEGSKRVRTKRPRAPRPPRPEGEDPAGEPSKNMLFVANLGFSTDDAALSNLFTEAGINVISARIVRRRWGQPRRSKGFGFVDVGSEEEQQKAIKALDGKEIGGRNIAVKIAVNTPHEEEAEVAESQQTEGFEATIVAA